MHQNQSGDKLNSPDRWWHHIVLMANHRPIAASLNRTSFEIINVGARQTLLIDDVELNVAKVCPGVRYIRPGLILTEHTIFLDAVKLLLLKGEDGSPVWPLFPEFARKVRHILID